MLHNALAGSVTLSVSQVCPVLAYSDALASTGDGGGGGGAKGQPDLQRDCLLAYSHWQSTLKLLKYEAATLLHDAGALLAKCWVKRESLSFFSMLRHRTSAVAAFNTQVFKLDEQKGVTVGMQSQRSTSPWRISRMLLL